jgi:hypothetical protein
MRAALAALALGVASPVVFAPVAVADGIERPKKAAPKAIRKARPKPAPAVRPAPEPAPAPIYYYPAPEEPKGPETVSLPLGFFAVGSAGGVGAGVSGGCCGGGGGFAIVGGGTRYSGLASFGGKGH